MRRAFAALVAATLLSVALAVPAVAQEAAPDPLNFRWMGVSDNTAEGVAETVVMSGNGWVIDGEVTASGSYNHTAAGPPPQELLSYGTWQADSLVSLEIIGTYGAVAAGTIVMDVTLFPEGGDPVAAQILMNCNVPPGSLFTGLPEGCVLTMGDSEFSPRLLPTAEGTVPPMLQVGATVFNTLETPPA